MWRDYLLWFKQRLIIERLSKPSIIIERLSKPSISQRSQFKEDTVEPSVPASDFNLKDSPL